MGKRLSAWWAAYGPTKRRLIQVYAALLYNAHAKGFIQGDIYTGSIKNLCVPGLNCYSCPGAIGACPLGALQNALAATGSRPFVPPIPGLDSPNVVMAVDAELHPEKLGKRVVIIGGGLVGAELAVSLAAEGHGCTVVEMRSAVAMDVSPFYRGGLMPQLEKAATLRTGAAVCRVEQDGVVIRTESGEEKLPADSVVCAAGFRPDYGQVDVLCAQVAESYVIGDCQRVGQIYQAMNQGYFTARRI